MAQVLLRAGEGRIPISACRRRPVGWSDGLWPVRQESVRKHDRREIRAGSLTGSPFVLVFPADDLKAWICLELVKSYTEDDSKRGAKKDSPRRRGRVGRYFVESTTYPRLTYCTTAQYKSLIALTATLPWQFLHAFQIRLGVFAAFLLPVIW